jgi:hypothetical protein
MQIKKIKILLIKILPISLLELIQRHRTFQKWKKNNYLGSTPQSVKEKLFEKYSVTGADWIESGTYLGTNTYFFSKRSKNVYSIEPQVNLYKAAFNRFKGLNILLFNDISENVFPKLLPTLKGDLNFWLDGHYSEGVTFQGNKECPIEDELNAIELNFDNFKKISIFIDDVRNFFIPTKDYPAINYLIDFARRLNLEWIIQHDIFIMRKKN